MIARARDWLLELVIAFCCWRVKRTRSRRWAARLAAAVGGRSPDQVLRMERARGLR